MKKRPVLFNGKFLSAQPTGVHRVAEELVRGIDILLEERGADGRTWGIISPKTIRRTLPLKHIGHRRAGLLKWQFWEQIELPILARGNLLVSLCNLAPIGARGAITMIHDAQVFISPESYSRPFAAWYQFALPRIGASASKILTVSEYSRQKLVEFGVAPAEKIEVIHNGVDHLRAIEPDTAALATFGLTPDSYVIALSNTQKHKNIRVLIEAFSRPEMAGVKLVLVGGEDRASFTEKDLHPGENVIFAGRVSDGELRALYEGAGCLAFPSTTEGFGLPPLEAMLAGCPTVVAPCGALPEVCGDAAIYVAADDASGWAREITRVLSDGALRKDLSIRGKAQAAKFTWRRSAERLLQIIDEEAARRDRRD